MYLFSYSGSDTRFPLSTSIYSKKARLRLRSTRQRVNCSQSPTSLLRAFSQPSSMGLIIANNCLLLSRDWIGCGKFSLCMKRLGTITYLVLFCSRLEMSSIFRDVMTP